MVPHRHRDRFRERPERERRDLRDQRRRHGGATADQQPGRRSESGVVSRWHRKLEVRRASLSSSNEPATGRSQRPLTLQRPGRTVIREQVLLHGRGFVREAVIVEAVRTPVGRKNGRLSGWHPVDLLAEVLRAAMERTGIDPARVDDQITGCVSQTGEQAINIGRNAWLAAGLPEEVPSTTIDRQCGSSQQAAHFAAQGVIAEAYDLVVASGIEHMTRVPLGITMSQGPGVPFSQRLLDRYEGGLVPQGISAEIIAERWDLSRRELDEFGLRSHERAGAAIREGRFDREIHPVKAEGPNGTEVFEQDEGVRYNTSIEKMAELPTPFKADGVVTAGNSSQISDGAGVLVIASTEMAHELRLKPRARFVSFALSGVDPITMLTGPISAT